MDELYAEDADAQFSALLIMPSVFLKTMREEFYRLGGAEGAHRAMFKCGVAVGRSISANVMLSEGQQIEEMLHLMWAEVGLGHLFVVENNRGRMVIRVERLLEAAIVGVEYACDFTRGCLAGIIEAVSGRPYGGVENTVENAPDTRIFIMGPV